MFARSGLKRTFLWIIPAGIESESDITILPVNLHLFSDNISNIDLGRGP